ncbi:hypothetical protein BD779DRAFT_1475822 [Infundibulicybe gibba]|nr:hypothetical protein BD779DRAFT_1475822 [Infundibulicybe gibba]
MPKLQAIHYGCAPMLALPSRCQHAQKNPECGRATTDGSQMAPADGQLSAHPPFSILTAMFATSFDLRNNVARLNWGCEPWFVWPPRVFEKILVNPRGFVPVPVAGTVFASTGPQIQ